MEFLKSSLTVIIQCLSVYFICCYYRKLPSDNLQSKAQLNRDDLKKEGKALYILRKTLP